MTVSDLVLEPEPTERPAGAALRASTGQIGAVVVGGDYQGLGIVRSLGRRRIPVCVVDDERSIAPYSRYATHALRVPDLRGEEATVKTMLELGSSLGLEGWVLYPTRDETVAAFSHYRDELSKVFRVPTPAWSSVQWAWDKRNTYDLAQRLGVPTPRTWYPASRDDLRLIDSPPPYAIKPAIKEHFIYATRAKAWRADTREQLVERFEQAAALVEPGEIMIQDFIPGGGEHQYAYCAFFKEGRVLASMVVRRRRQHPPDFGRASTYVETICEPVLEALSERLLAAIDYYGLVELEFKRDPRDGQYRLLDFNARTWGYHTLGPRAGVDFPYLLFADQVGAKVEPCRARPNVGWVRLVTDLPTAALQILHGQLRLTDYLASLCRCREEAVFSLRDPKPGLVELALIRYLTLKRGF